jgi:hypothetical protein
MVILKADKDTEAGVLPNEKILTEMGQFNVELVNAGMMLAGEGLYSSSKGARVVFAGTKRTVVRGPFARPEDLVAGFWIWKVASLDEAIEWAKRIANPAGVDDEVELRPIFEAEDFGAEFTPELQAQESRLRAVTAKLSQGAGI